MSRVPGPEYCEWCHRPLTQRRGVGRPRRFCSPAHRQRAYEARRQAEALGVPAHQCLVAVADLNRLHDLVYRLESAIEDVRSDLGDTPEDAEYRAAFEHLMDAAGDLIGTVVEPVQP